MPTPPCASFIKWASGTGCAAAGNNSFADEHVAPGQTPCCGQRIWRVGFAFDCRVPPGYRVNGEIILADDDALTPDEITPMAHSLLNEFQRQKFEQEWELCISLLHPVAGRVRVTFYRRNGRPEMSFRFCGDRIPNREELGLPAKIDEMARRPNGLFLITGPTGAGKTTTLNYMVDVINAERRCKI